MIQENTDIDEILSHYFATGSWITIHEHQTLPQIYHGIKRLFITTIWDLQIIGVKKK